jgi:hypothetical protein
VVPGVAVTGAWLSAALDGQAGHLMQVTDEVGRRLAELQLTFGEGPLLDASVTGGPVLASDLADAESASRWPAFAPAASAAGAAATMLLLDAQDGATGGAARGAGPGGQPAGLAARRAEVDQATGMLTEQLGVSVTDAFVRLRAYAYVNDIQLADVARDIVARRLRLFPDPDLPLGDKT